MTRVLILGGTGDAVALANRLAAAGHAIVYSLAGVTKSPNLPACEIRMGGFGGADGMAKYLRSEGIEAVIDATHPYARQIAQNAAAAAASCGRPHIKFLRPPWRAEPGDNWIEVPGMAEAASRAAAFEGTVFVTVGSKDLAHFMGPAKGIMLVRLINEPEPGTLPKSMRLITQRGPFGLANERELFRRHEVGLLVSKNAGGPALAPKLVAARELSVPVVMIRRPDPPDARIEGSIPAVEAWLADPG